MSIIYSEFQRIFFIFYFRKSIFKKSKRKSILKKVAIGVGVTVLGGAAAIVAAPLVLGAVGFGAGGIAGGSVAAAWMSSAAIANGGGM